MRGCHILLISPRQRTRCSGLGSGLGSSLSIGLVQQLVGRRISLILRKWTSFPGDESEQVDLISEESLLGVRRGRCTDADFWSEQYQK